MPINATTAILHHTHLTSAHAININPRRETHAERLQGKKKKEKKNQCVGKKNHRFPSWLVNSPPQVRVRDWFVVCPIYRKTKKPKNQTREMSDGANHPFPSRLLGIHPKSDFESGGGIKSPPQHPPRLATKQTSNFLKKNPPFSESEWVFIRIEQHNKQTNSTLCDCDCDCECECDGQSKSNRFFPW